MVDRTVWEAVRDALVRDEMETTQWVSTYLAEDEVDRVMGLLRDEILRTAAAKIRTFAGPRAPINPQEKEVHPVVKGYHGAADLIDPSKETS